MTELSETGVETTGSDEDSTRDESHVGTTAEGGGADTNLDRVEFLFVRVDDTSYAIESGRLRRVAYPTSITPVPRTPERIRGVAAVDGETTVVTDAGIAFGHPTASTAGSRLVVLERKDEPLGLLVDNVEGFETVDVDRISLTTEDSSFRARIAEPDNDDSAPDTPPDGVDSNAPSGGTSPSAVDERDSETSGDRIAVVDVDALFEAVTS